MNVFVPGPARQAALTEMTTDQIDPAAGPAGPPCGYAPLHFIEYLLADLIFSSAAKLFFSRWL